MTNIRRPSKTIGVTIVLIAAAAWAIHAARPVRPTMPAARPTIVSLAPSATEIVFALGKGNAVIGVTDRCNYPPQTTAIARIGGFGDPNVEQLLALAPDVVIAAGLERRECAEVLRRSGIRVVEVRTRNFDELFEAIRKIGDAIDASAVAERLVTQMRDDLQAIASRVRSRSAAHRPKVFVEIGDHPLMTAGAASFLDDLITRVGAVNVAHDLPQAYPQINPEQVVAWNPDIILIAQMERPQEAIARLAQRIGWSGISAVKHGRVIADLDPDVLLRPGPRLIDGLKALADRLDTMHSNNSRDLSHAAQP
jgi:iron complex transport system substrate-binding protein